MHDVNMTIGLDLLAEATVTEVLQELRVESSQNMPP
jgi:hypothetical protein